jgi:hypothetical protein
MNGSPEASPRLESLQKLLEAGADPKQRDALGRTPLHHAASAGDVNAIERLLRAGADIDARDLFDNTPLMLAVNPEAAQSTATSTAFGFLSQICSHTWKILGAAHELALSYGEETITDNLCLALKAASLPEVQVYKVSKPAESKSGVDIELYVGNDREGWWSYFVQAKRVEVVRMWYSHLLHTRARDGKYQFDLLEEHARVRNAIPLYAFYSFVTTANPGEHYHCKVGSEVSLLGWTLATTATVRPFIEHRTIPTFDEMHRPQTTLPARCLLCARLANAAKAEDHPLAGDFIGAARARALPPHIANRAFAGESGTAVLGDWIAVIDTSRAWVAPCVGC